MARAYERLALEPVRATADRLVERMAARIPGRDLLKVAAELIRLIDDVGAGASQTRGRLRTARIVSRGGLTLVVAGAVALFVVAARDAFSLHEPESSVDWIPLIEAAINDLVFVAIAVFFLYSVPDRLERSRLLTLLYRLRSLAHIIDMHQLTKDPERVRTSYQPTVDEVELGLDRMQMEAYLEYCTELLSLVGKTAALCAEESRDQVVLDTVRAIETLTVSLSREIWQKIALLPPATPETLERPV